MRNAAALFVLALPLPAADLFRDDFSKLPPRVFSEPVKQLTNALHEYHYVEHRGVRLHPWENALIHEDVWAGGDEDGQTYVEMHVPGERPNYHSSILVTGDPAWTDYTIEAKVRPLSFKHWAGIVFRYHTNRHHYLFVLRDGAKIQILKRLPLESSYQRSVWQPLAEAPFSYTADRYYLLKVENDGPRMRAFVDGKPLLEASDGEILQGRIGVAAIATARFTDVRVTAPDAVKTKIEASIAARERELAALRAANPGLKLWKKFDTPRFGAGRNVRFGDLDGDGKVDMLIAQNTRKAYKNSYSQITCLTAVNLDGKVLWQMGRPDPYNDVLANDTPFQIHDVDGDGTHEVVLVRDFKIQILDGKTGKLKQWTWMPEAPKDNKERPYEREVGDSIAFFHYRDSKHRDGILVKDRYRTFWVFDRNLKLQWEAQCNSGHFPYPVDVDGDGREEIMMGYSLFSHDGRKLWSLDGTLKDHADGVVMGNFTGDPKAPLRGYIQGSDEGYLMLDAEGKILKHVRIGHAQSPAVAKFRTDLPGLQLITANFWRNPGIVTLFDMEGNILAQEEPVHHASPLLPVNWKGDGEEYALLSPNPREGGMLDGKLRRAVMFPDDGHPDLASAVMDLTGDSRDEIVCWDAHRVWIYTQDRPYTGKKLYAPVRSPDYNESNYRTTTSLPAWREAK